MMRLFLFIILFPILLFSQSLPKYPSLLWKITGNGLKNPSYLYGTMHVSNKIAYNLSDQFFEALKSVDVVGLETDPGEWLQNMQKIGELSDLNKFNENNVGNKNFYKTTFRTLFPQKELLQAILSTDPDIINGLLYRKNSAKDEFEESTYIDLFIYQFASKLNKQIISLENFFKSEIKSRLAEMPDESSEDNESLNSYKNSYLNVQQIEDAYRNGNLDILDSLSKQSSSKNNQRFLINERNVFFVNTIDSVLKNKTLFSGVGAAHLPGDDGLIELLRKKGYLVEPIMPKISKKSLVIREKLEKMIKPREFQKQFMEDSLFSVDLPGKFYPVSNIETLNYFIHADMANGCFYSLMRLKHHAPLYHVSVEAIFQKVDSLLFEFIPGKIKLRQQIISNNGIKGIEIVSEISNGDVQQYQIFFTDLEMIMFKLGGKKNYNNSSDAKRFFNSIQFKNKPDDLIDFTPKTKGFSVKTPLNYFYSKIDGPGLIGETEDLVGYQKKTSLFVGVKHAVYNDFDYLEEDTFELKQLAKNILERYSFSIDKTYQLLNEQGFPTIHFSAKNKLGHHFLAKIYIKGVHYYFVFASSPQPIDFENMFFKSFKLTDFNYINPIKNITDRKFYFNSKDEITDNLSSQFNELFLKEYDLVKTKKDSSVYNFYSEKFSKYYYSPSTNEYTNINFEKYNDYDYRNIKEMDKRIEDKITHNTSLFISNKKSTIQQSGYLYTCLLKDTATQRAIDYRVFFKNGFSLELSTPFDTTIGLKGWAKDFVESFNLMDTAIGKYIFENKINQFLNDVSGNDTLLRRRANQSLSSFVIHKDFSNDLIKFISGPKINFVNENSRAQLFVNMGTLDNQNIILPYKLLYKNYTDSFYLQLCLIKGLAYLKTEKSYQAIYDLLLSETPLVGYEYTVADVFNVFHDSLELCRQFFPGLLKLTKYDEFRPSIYSLLASLVNQKLINPNSYLSQKETLFSDANLALKRYNTASNTLSGNDYPNLNLVDKSIQELAYTIKFVNDGLANNNLYKNLYFQKKIDSYYRNPIVNYSYVLAPFYKTDVKIKQWFDKLLKLKNISIQLPTLINLLKYNSTFNDTLISYYSKNIFTRTYFYSELEKEHLLEKVDNRLFTQLNLAESVIACQIKWANFFIDDKEKTNPDSLELLKIIEVKNKYQKGKLYLFCNKKNKNTDNELWHSVFIDDSKKINSKIELFLINAPLDRLKSKEENIQYMLDYFYTSFRKRAIVNSNSTDE